MRSRGASSRFADFIKDLRTGRNIGQVTVSAATRGNICRSGFDEQVGAGTIRALPPSVWTLMAPWMRPTSMPTKVYAFRERGGSTQNRSRRNLGNRLRVGIRDPYRWDRFVRAGLSVSPPGALCRDPARYLLLVEWDRLQDHKDGFRGSPEHQECR